jgi:hypothetical protein
MKPLLLTIILSTSLLIISNRAEAQNQGFGVGAQITSPAGLSAKAWLNETSALASVVSFNINSNNSSFYTHLDYLMHKNYDQLGWDVGVLSYYYGGGVRFIWREVGFDNTFWAIRLPAGLNFNFAEVPVDFYMEIAPTFDVSPDFNFGFTGGIGFRYFLN